MRNLQNTGNIATKTASRKLPLWGLGLLFFSLYLTGPKYVLNLGIKVTPTDIIILAELYILAIYFLIKGRSLWVTIPMIPSLLFFLFILITVVDLWRVEWPVQNITLTVGLIRNALIVFLVACCVSLLGSSQGELLRLVSQISICVSVASIIMYFGYLPLTSNIKANPGLWKPDIWYNLRENGVLSLSGPGRDPNFFGAVNIIGLIAILVNQRGKGYKIGSCVILLALGLTFSRTILLLLVALFIMFCILSLARKKMRCLTLARNRYCKIGIIFLIHAFAFQFLGLGGRPIDIFKSRFVNYTQEGSNDRLYLWEKATQAAATAPFWGQGGRYVQVKYGQYVHNDYLEILSSYGIVGLTTMVAFLIATAIFGLSCLVDEVGIATYVMFWCYLFLMCTFSIFFNQNLYFIIGILWARSVRSGYASKSN